MWCGVVGSASVHFLTFRRDFGGFLLFGLILVDVCPFGLIFTDFGVDLNLLVGFWPLVGPKKYPEWSFD